MHVRFSNIFEKKVKSEWTQRKKKFLHSEIGLDESSINEIFIAIAHLWILTKNHICVLIHWWLRTVSNRAVFSVNCQTNWGAKFKSPEILIQSKELANHSWCYMMIFFLITHRYSSLHHGQNILWNCETTEKEKLYWMQRILKCLADQTKRVDPQPTNVYLVLYNSKQNTEAKTIWIKRLSPLAVHIFTQRRQKFSILIKYICHCVVI